MRGCRMALWAALLLVWIAATPVLAAGKKIVFLAGTKSHGPGDHEYEKGLRLLARCLETSPDTSGYRTEVHLYGWPEDPKTLDDADTIVLYADGSDHDAKAHPLLVGDRLKTIERQMKRGCGLVLLHYATFAPVKRGGPEYLDWVGGFFDYETGSAANHWLSRIDNAAFDLKMPRPDHPICSGLAPFTLKDELYHHMRQRANDLRRTAILTAQFPGGDGPQEVAWAVQRETGGRGFAFTGGHYHGNWRNESVRRTVLNAIVWTAQGIVPAAGVRSSVPDDIDALRVAVVTGRHHPAHDWKATTAALRDVLGGDSRVALTVWEDPEQLARADLSKVDVLVQNYCNWESPSLSAAARSALLTFVRRGGGLVLLHFANGAWRDWPEYFGGLARRVWVDGKASHDAYGEFAVTVTGKGGRLTEGLPNFTTRDELYCSQVGDRPVEPMLTARSQVTGKDEPLAFVYSEGKGRIFQTLLGHDAGAVRQPVHAELIRRATAWCAGREILPQAVKPAPPARARLVDGRFGKALVGGGNVAAPGGADFQEPPLTVEVWAKLNGAAGYNLLVANSDKESPRHWELYSEPGSGTLSAYLPGASPQNVTSDARIVDGAWHHVAMVYLPGRVKLFVDARLVADTAIGVPHATARIGPVYFGGYPHQGLGCDGLIDEVRISRGVRTEFGGPYALDPDTLGLWRFDDPELKDESPSGRHAASRSAAPTAAATLPEFPPAPWPRIDRARSVDWRTVGNDPGGMRKSPLAQINRTNVGKLKVAWTYAVGDAGAGTTIECTPIVVEGVMYLTTVSQRIVALDAATGKPIWRFDPRSGGVNRGVAYWTDGKAKRILFGSGNGRLWSLDARTGTPDPAFGDSGSLDLRAGYEKDLSKLGYGVTSPPAVFENLVLIPIINSEGQPGAPGDVRAFDVRTGREVWRFHTVPKNYEPFVETWGKNGWKDRSGTNPWSGFTIDTKNGIVFCATGSPASDFYGADRPGANVFGNCVLALDARTGKRLWHFQTVHHDVWDYDNPCPPVLGTIVKNGKTIEIVSQPTKTGYVYVFERKTGKSLFPIREVPAPPSDIPGERTFATQPMPTAPPPLSRQGFRASDITNRTPSAEASVRAQLQKLKWGRAHLPPSVQGTVVAPGFHGGANWSGASFDPEAGLLYVNTNDVPYISALKPNASGGFDFGGYTYFNDDSGHPAMKPPWGWLTAVDLVRGTFRWRIPFGYYPEIDPEGKKGWGAQTFGGTIVTAGGLVFIAGSPDERLHAYDAANGTLLWSYKLPAGGYATPCTYSVNGRQFLVIAAGGGGKLGTKSGDTYIAFALE